MFVWLPEVLPILPHETGVDPYKFNHWQNRGGFVNKKLIVLAVSTVFCSPLASADDGFVTLYGKINVGAERIKAEGCNDAPVSNAAGTTFGAGCTGSGNVKSRARVTDSFSYIGF